MLPRPLLPLLRLALFLGLVAVAAPSAHAGDLKFELRLGGKHPKLAVHAGYGHGYGYGGVISGKHRYGRPASCSTHKRCVPGRQWVPGHYETVERRVWVPETREKAWIPAHYETRYDSCGRAYQVLARPGEWRVVHHPGRFETRCERVWVPGGYRTSCASY